MFFHRDRDSHGGGVCLLVANSIKCLSVSFDLDLPGCEMLCVDLVTHDGHLRLVVCYRSTSLAHQSLEMNFRLINCLNKNCAMLNIHVYYWAILTFQKLTGV